MGLQIRPGLDLESRLDFGVKSSILFGVKTSSGIRNTYALVLDQIWTFLSSASCLGAKEILCKTNLIWMLRKAPSQSDVFRRVRANAHSWSCLVKACAKGTTRQAAECTASFQTWGANAGFGHRSIKSDECSSNTQTVDDRLYSRNQGVLMTIHDLFVCVDPWRQNATVSYSFRIQYHGHFESMSKRGCQVSCRKRKSPQTCQPTIGDNCCNQESGHFVDTYKIVSFKILQDA